MTAAPTSQWCVRLVRARWVLSVDGHDLASSSDLSGLERLAELAGAEVVHLAAEFSSWEEDRALTEELQDAVVAHMGRLAGPGTGSSGLAWMTGWLVAGYPDVAREALASLRRHRSTPTERPSRPGELCTCGRPATVVFLTEMFGEVGHCGLPGVDPLLPCPFCGTEETHREPWGDAARCPDYRLSPGAEGGAR
jgi:hypothetical protein